MELQASDSKKIYKVFESTKRLKCRKKKEHEESYPMGNEESRSLIQAHSNGNESSKTSVQDVSGRGEGPKMHWSRSQKRETSCSRSPSPARTVSRGPRNKAHRICRTKRDKDSLALHAGMVSTPRSISPQQDGDEGMPDSTPRDQDYIYTFLEEEVKKDKRKQRRHRSQNLHRESRERIHGHDYGEQRDEDRPQDRPDKRPSSRHRTPESRTPERRNRDRDRDHDRERDEWDLEGSPTRSRRVRRHRRRHETLSPDNEKPVKEKSVIDQAALLETFAKLCTTITEKNYNRTPNVPAVVRCHSHKSLQCKVPSVADCDAERSRLLGGSTDAYPDGCLTDSENYPREAALKYGSKVDMVPSQMRAYERDLRLGNLTRSCVVQQPRPCGEYRSSPARDRARYDEDRRRYYEEERRRCCEQKLSRSFDLYREFPPEEGARRTSRSDPRRRRLEERVRDPDRRYDDHRKYNDERDKDFRDRHYQRVRERDRRCRPVERDRPQERDRDRDRDRASLASRDEPELDACSERAPDSEMSVPDDVSTLSGKTNYLRIVKQGVAEQREAMENMMKLWKELMRCFKTISPGKTAQDSAATMQASAAAQLRLWRECMQRYETVARDVGDTDARLMEEIAKQRSEMAEMGTMWQECLQRYRDMSTEFTNLKQKVLSSEVPSPQPARTPAPVPPVAEPERAPPAPYHPSLEADRPHLSTHFPYPAPLLPPMAGAYGGGVGMGGGGRLGSPLRARASLPPAWWWMNEPPPAPPAHRRSSPDSRRSGSYTRDKHRHNHRDRDDTRYKDKSSKPNASRSEHRHRRR